MTKLLRAVALLVTVVIGVACAACTNDTSSSAAAGSTRSSTPPSSTQSSATGDVPPPPKVGQCRNTPASNRSARLGRPDPSRRLFEDPHARDLRGHHAGRETHPGTAKQLAASCETPAVNYLDISTRAIRTIDDQVVYRPSPAQRAAGQNWLRCDVGVKATTHCCRRGLAPVIGSLRGAVGSDPARFQICIDQLPDPTRDQPLASCKKPHRAELLPDNWLELEVAHYPSAATLSKKGQSGCAKFVAHRKDRNNLVITPDWQPRAEWSGGTLEGDCWIHRKAGLMPPIE